MHDEQTQIVSLLLQRPDGRQIPVYAGNALAGGRFLSKWGPMIPRLPNEDLEEKDAMGIRTADQRYIFLKTGELFFTADPALVETVLGSSLAIVMFSRQRRLSAICQGFLPRCLKRADCAGECAQAGLIVECSVMIMADRFRRIGISPDDIKVKVIGGAEMPEPASIGAGAHQVGRQNAAAALERIEQEGLTVAAMEVGGTDGRRLMFDTGKGQVLVRRLPLLVEENEAAPGDETAWKSL